MIIGLGSDLCNIERIQSSLDRIGERFENRVFTETERAKARRRPFTIAGTYAKRFAAKEAALKALGLGLGGNGLPFAGDPAGFVPPNPLETIRRDGELAENSRPADSRTVNPAAAKAK